MKVKELIELLSEFDEDLDVFVKDEYLSDSTGYRDVKSVATGCAQIFNDCVEIELDELLY